MFKELAIIDMYPAASHSIGYIYGYIWIDIRTIIFKDKYDKYSKIRSIKEMVDIINELFLTEFICHEMSGGIHNNIDCTPKWQYACAPRVAAAEMMVVND